MLKKTTFLALTVIVAMQTIYAQTAKMTIVNGTNNKDKKLPVLLYSVVEGEKLPYASTNLDVDNNFAFAISNCTEGFYYITDSLKRDFVRIYLKKGDKLTINLEKAGKYEIVNGSPENKALYKWNSIADNVARYGIAIGDTVTYHTFFPNLAKSLIAAKTFKTKIGTPNVKFNGLMKTTVDFDIERSAVRFLLIPRTAHPVQEQYPPYYASLAQTKQFNNTAILQIGEAADYMSLYATFETMLMRKKEDTARITPELYLRKALSYFKNDTIKGIYLANALHNYRTYESLVAATEPNKQYFLTPLAKEKYFYALKSKSTFKEGMPAYNFEYPDINGKKVSLNDLKGKVVVVDIWATWCGPCRKEMPHLKTLEEEMKDNINVAFVSISVDEEKDYQKWKDFVNDQSLGGIQLYAKGWSKIVNFYNVTGIPRFMVFDKEGKIISIDAPRPSTPELKAMIEKALL